MAFSCKIVLSEYSKEDGMHQVLLQAIIDRKRAKIPLGFYLSQKDFDQRTQSVRANNLNAKDYNKELITAIAKGNTIASQYRIENKTLTCESFREEYRNNGEQKDFIKFVESELKLKTPSIAPNTLKQHTTVINKLRLFRKKIQFNEINIQLIQKFRNHLIDEDKNGNSTVEKIIKIVKQYIGDAQKKGIKISDSYRQVKIKTFKSNRLSLTQEEVDLIDKYYEALGTLPSHKKLLRYFLFSCVTGLRISDIKRIKWNTIHGNMIIFLPEKTKATQKTTTIPLLETDKKYLPEFKLGNGPIFDTYADAVSNRYLKDVADKLKIKKKITYHTSRHTFGSLFAEGGNIVALKEMMGHGDIKTTMGYVHTSTKNLVDAKNKRFGIENPVKTEPKN